MAKMIEILVRMVDFIFSTTVEEVRELTHFYFVKKVGDELWLTLIVGEVTNPLDPCSDWSRRIRVRVERSVVSIDEARDVVRAELRRCEEAAETVKPSTLGSVTRTPAPKSTTPLHKSSFS